MNEELFIEMLFNNKQEKVQYFPDKGTAEYFIDEIFQFLFICQPHQSNAAKAMEKYGQLKHTFAALLFEIITDEAEVKKHTSDFFDALPGIYKKLFQDAEAILQSDPAARNIAEVVVAYPGFYATVVYRLSHQLWIQGITILPRLFCEYAHGKTGIDIHPGAKIGSSFAIDHGTGIVIGETTIIGNRVKIYQGVTLGALSVDKTKASSKRHPTIEDDVVIYSGATILGGDTVIGKGSVIGGNVWLTYSVPSNSIVYHKSEIKIKDREPFPEPLNFVI